jgi:hypothetical protein
VLENRKNGGRVVGLRASLRLPREKTRVKSDVRLGVVAPEAAAT